MGLQTMEGKSLPRKLSPEVNCLEAAGLDLRSELQNFLTYRRISFAKSGPGYGWSKEVGLKIQERYNHRYLCTV